MTSYPNLRIVGTKVSNVPALNLTFNLGYRYYYSKHVMVEAQIKRPDGTIYTTGMKEVYWLKYTYGEFNLATVFATKADSYLMDVCKKKFGAGFETSETNFKPGVHYIRGITYYYDYYYRVSTDTGWIPFTMPEYDVAPETASISTFYYRVRGYYCANAYFNPYFAVCAAGYGIFDPNSRDRHYFTQRIELMAPDGTIQSQDADSYKTGNGCTGLNEMSNMNLLQNDYQHIRLSVYHRQMGYLMATTGWVRNGVVSLNSVSNNCTGDINDNIQHYINYTMGEYLPDVPEKKSGDDLTLSYTVNSTYKDTTDWTLVPIFKGATDIIINDYRIVNLGLDTGPVTITNNITIPVTTKSGYYKLYIYYDTANLTYPKMPRYEIDTSKLLYIDTSGIPSLMSASVSCGTITVR